MSLKLIIWLLNKRGKNQYFKKGKKAQGASAEVYLFLSVATGIVMSSYKSKAGPGDALPNHSGVKERGCWRSERTFSRSHIYLMVCRLSLVIYFFLLKYDLQCFFISVV